MWIKAIYCTKDRVYANRLMNFLDKEYGNKIELDICSSVEALFEYISQDKVDMVLFGDEFEAKVQARIKDIPCSYACIAEQLYDSMDEEAVQIDKYQRGDKIYKSIVDAYAGGRKIKRIHTDKEKSGEQKIYVFTSANGGCGTSSVARAYAKRCASYEKVLYIDFGLFYSMEVTDGNPNGMDEIILALKSRRNILPLKLSSAVSSTAHRVYTYGPCSNPVDLLELNKEDIGNFIDGMAALSEYKKIIVDIGTSISLKEIELMKRADVIVYILEESDIGKKKYECFCRFLESVGKKEQMRLIRKMTVFRNKVKQDRGQGAWNMEEQAAGWAPYVSMDSYDAVIDRIARSDSFSNLVQYSKTV